MWPYLSNGDQQQQQQNINTVGNKWRRTNVRDEERKKTASVLKISTETETGKKNVYDPIGLQKMFFFCFFFLKPVSNRRTLICGDSFFFECLIRACLHFVPTVKKKFNDKIKWISQVCDVCYSFVVFKSLLCGCSATSKNLISFGKYRSKKKTTKEITTRSQLVHTLQNGV